MGDFFQNQQACLILEDIILYRILKLNFLGHLKSKEKLWYWTQK